MFRLWLIASIQPCFKQVTFQLCFIMLQTFCLSSNASYSYFTSVKIYVIQWWDTMKGVSLLPAPYLLVWYATSLFWFPLSALISPFYTASMFMVGQLHLYSSSLFWIIKIQRQNGALLFLHVWAVTAASRLACKNSEPVSRQDERGVWQFYDMLCIWPWTSTVHPKVSPLTLPAEDETSRHVTGVVKDW